MHLQGCTHAASLSSASVAKQTQQDLVFSSSTACSAWGAWDCELAMSDAGNRGFSIITNTSSIFCVWTRLAKTSYCFCYLYYLILFQTKKTHCTNVSQLLYHYHSTITMQYTSFSNFLFYVDSGWLTQADWLWLTD